MTYKEQELYLLQSLKKATVNALTKNGELPRIKAYIAATLYAEIMNQQKPVDSRFSYGSAPSKEDLDVLIRILTTHGLKQTLKVLQLELGLTGEYISMTYNSAHYTSESMSISPNRYTDVKPESDSFYNELHESDGFEFTNKGRKPNEVPVRPASAAPVLEIGSKPEDFYPKVDLAQEQDNIHEQDDDLGDFDDLADLDFAPDNAGKNVLESAQGPDFGASNPAQEQDIFADEAMYQAVVAYNAGSAVPAEDTKHLPVSGTSAQNDIATKSAAGKDSFDDFEDLEDLGFDEPQIYKPANAKHDSASAAKPVAYSNALDDLDDFNDLDAFDQPAAAHAAKQSNKNAQPGLLDDLDNFDDLDNLDFSLQKPVTADKQAANPSNIDELKDFEDFADFEAPTQPKAANKASKYSYPDVDNLDNLDDLDNFDDLEDFGAHEQLQKASQSKQKISMQPKTITKQDANDDFAEFENLEDLDFPTADKKDAKHELDDLDKFDDLEDLDMDFGAKPKSGAKDDFDFPEFDDL